MNYKRSSSLLIIFPFYFDVGNLVKNDNKENGVQECFVKENLFELF